MATQNFINECKNMANANRLCRFRLGGGGSGDLIVYGNSTQSGTPTPSNPVPIVSKTGWITEIKDGATYEINLGNIKLCKIGDNTDCIKKMAGKNIFDKSLGFQLGYLSSTNVFVPDNYNALFNQDIEVIPGQKYTFSVNQNIDNMVISFFNGDTFIGRQKNTNTNKITYTMANNVNKVKWCICKSQSTLITQEIINGLEPMVEKDTNRTTPYEPYQLNWYIEKNTDEKIYTGSSDENWYRSNLTFYLSQTSPKTNYSLCTHFINQGDSSWGNNDASYRGKYTLGYTANQVKFMPVDEQMNTVDKWKTWLSSNNVTVLHPLATPTYTKITDETLISQLENPVNEINQSNHLKSITLTDSCCVNNEIIGSIYTKSADVELLDLPANMDLVGEELTPEIGVRYSNDTTEYITFDNYIVESLKDEQTASNTSFTAMNGGTLLDTEYDCTLTFDEGETHTIQEFYEDACEQIGLTPTDETFDNDDIELTGNPFTNRETIRTVFSEVEKVSCSIMKFDWANMEVSLTWLSNQIDYEFNTSDYSTLEGSLTKYGPLNVIMVGNSQLDGENVTMTDEESVAQYGEHQILIDSPYFLYTEELRSQAIEAIYNKLDGLTYYDLKLTTPFGKPFLEVGNKIRINTNENQVYDTYVLSHTFKYDGTFNSVIESPALTSEEQTIKNEYKNNSIKERLKRTEVIVDKTTGEITSLTTQTQSISNDLTGVQNELSENYYTIEQSNQLIQTAQTGITNTFSEAGGNNIFRNTGLWFENTGNDAQQNPYEFWQGNVKRAGEELASNLNALVLQNSTLMQEQAVPDGTYTISFKYRKEVPLANVSVIINNGEPQVLTSTTDTDFLQTIDVNTKHINIQFVSDTNDSCYIYDLMVNAGNVKLAYSQNQNETTTDTVNISKGITITSSDKDVIFKANADGIRTLDRNDNRKTEFTDTGMITTRATIEEEAEIVSLLHKRVGDHIWVNKVAR